MGSNPISLASFLLDSEQFPILLSLNLLSVKCNTHPICCTWAEKGLEKTAKRHKEAHSSYQRTKSTSVGKKKKKRERDMFYVQETSSLKLTKQATLDRAGNVS